MIDTLVAASLRNLDELLLRVCDAEQGRAERIAGDGATGWDGVRNMSRPAVEELAFSPAVPESPLVPAVPQHAFNRLRKIFRLSAVEVDALLVLLSPHVESRYRALYAVLQDDLHQPWVTERVLLTVLGRSPERRRVLAASLAESGRLVGSGLLQVAAGTHPPLARPLDLAPEIKDALIGLPRAGQLGGLTVEWSAPSGTGAPEEITPRCQVLHGAGERLDLAQRIADDANVPLVAVRLGAQRDDGVARALWRLGAATGALPAVDVGALDAPYALSIAAELHRLSSAFGGPILVLSTEPLPLAAQHREAAALGFVERRRLWLDESARDGERIEESLAGRLASNHRLGRAGVRSVLASSSARTDEALTETAHRLTQVPIRHGLRVSTSRSFDDLVVRDTTRAALERLVFYVRSRDRVSEERGLEKRFRLHRGPIVLFSGRSGTGKTLAAEVVANTIGRPLHVIDLSRLVSKYIGETEKNIDEVLTAGERAGAVLFFDEADSLFSTRTEVSNSNDRFANLEVGYLLQRIERHDGLVILATNLSSAIDEAFLRRFHTRVEFPFPQPADRHRIWELMLPPGVTRAPDVDLAALAERHRLAGGDIRNAALKAIFLAEQETSPLAQAHLDRAVAIELLELGRLSRLAVPEPGERDYGALLRRFTEALHEVLDAELRRRFLKEIHILHGAPTKETLAGRRPAVSVALYRMVVAPGDPTLHLGFVVSAWSNRPEEEHELLGVLHTILVGAPLRAVDGHPVQAQVQESYDFDLLHRFWSSHGHPMRASLVLGVEVR